MNIAFWQTEQARKYGAQVGLVFGGRELTNETLYDDARRVARGLVQLGFAPGDRAIVALPSGVELFTACSAIWMAGGVVVVLGDVPLPAVERACAHCTPTLIVRRDLAAANGGVEWISASGRREAGWPELAGAPPLDAPLPRTAGAPAQLCYTSGTTSEPRAVVQTHGGIDAFWRMFSARPGAAVPNPTLLLALPPTAFAGSLIGARCTGNLRYVVLERFDAAQTLSAIERHRVTELPLVPAMAQQLIARASPGLTDLSSLAFVTVSGAHVPAELVSQLRRRLSNRAPAKRSLETITDRTKDVAAPTVIVAYGMTETNGCASTTHGGDGVVGGVIPGAEVRIVDSSGAVLQRGQQGEILVRTPYAAAQYWNDPAASAHVFDAGFVHSGDIGRFNERDELCVLGRLKEVIIQGGQNIYPEEIASVVRSCAGVDDCAAVSVADDLLGEAAVACVVRKAGASVAEPAIHAHCRRHLDARKLPTHVLFFERFPHSDVGKLQVAELRALADGRLTAARDDALTKRLSAADRHGRISLLTSLIEEALADALPEDTVSADSSELGRPFGERGLDSIGVVRLARALGKRLGRRISSTLLFAHSSTGALARHLAEPEENVQCIERAPGASPEGAIAIVGIGCRLPGGARTPADFWALLTNGVDAVGRAPPFRSLDADWQACFLDGIDRFDERFFGLAAEAAELDPRHRMVLEVGWEALEDAGIVSGAVVGFRTGVFLGIYGERYRSPSALGTAPGMAIARLCHFLDMRGPALSIDTTCSSSLVAVHEAVESLRRGECERALCGGVNLLASRVPAASGLAAGDGRSKAFDARADGFGQGEGCVFVVLETVEVALERGDRVYAVIKGSAVNHDGRSASLTAPNVLAQDEVLRSALRRADVHPDQVQYVETHGTGTRLGDPVEVDALARVFGGRAHLPLRIGSVKTNVGHLEAAAGIAGLVKVALAISHRRLPPSLHFAKPNPLIPWDDIPIRVQDTLGSWPGDGTLVGGVSSFGMSGTNAHVVLAEAPEAMRDSTRAEASMHGARLLPLSARSAAALRARAAQLATLLETQEIGAAAVDIGYTASRRRSHLENRIGIVGGSREEWARGLRGFLESTSYDERASSTQVGVAMVFSGQGMPSWSTTRVLLREEPVFREALERCAAEIERHVPWRLLEALPKAELAGAVAPTDIAQPAIFALQVSLYELWRSWGVEPRAVTGHSLGEIAAAYASGALSLADAARLACVRGRIMQRAVGSGRMAHVGIAVVPAEDFIRELGSSELEVAADNGPRSVTLTGTAAAIEGAMRLLRARGIATKLLAVDHAFHSRAFEPFREELRAELQPFAAASPRRPLISTAGVGESPALDAAYWANQMRSRVHFRTAIRTLLDRACNAFVEIGAQPVLRSAIEDCFRAASVDAVAVSAQPRAAAGRRGLLEALARLYRFGYPVDWSRQYPERGRVVTLPPYPWEHRRHWHAALESEKDAPIGPLVQRRSMPGGVDAPCNYESRIDLAEPALAYLVGHRVLGEAWLPATALLEAAREAAAHDQGSDDARLEDVELENALVLNVGRPQALHISFSGSADRRRFEVLTTGDAADPVRLASGTVRRGLASAEPAHINLADVKQRCTSPVDLSELRARLAEAGFDFGADFMGVEGICAGEIEAIGRLRSSARVTATADGYGVHPAILDSAFRLCAAIPVLGHDERRLVIPKRLDSFTVTPRARAAWTYVRASQQDGGVRFDVALCDEGGRVVARIEGLHAEPAGAGDRDAHALCAIEWRPIQPPMNRREGGAWLVLNDHVGEGALLRAAIESRGGRVRTIDRGEVELAHLRSLPGDLRVAEPIDGIVFLSALDIGCGDTDAADVVATSPLVALAKLTRVMDQMAWKTQPRLVIVTRGAQPADGDTPGLAQAPFWGFGATLALERPEWHLKLVDLDPREPTAAALCDELWDDETQRIALRGNRRLAPAVLRHRLVRAARTSSLLQVEELGYEAAVARLGSLESVELRRAERRAPSPNELELRVRATALNFRDALIALGRYPGDGAVELLGGECAGVVTRVGEGVTEYTVGDEVIAIGGGLLRSFATVPVSHVRRKLPFLSFAQAASMSVAFATALFALERVARVKAGERVLIHAASGGVGLAAIQHCRRVGAEPLVTAGSQRKREFLRSMGIAHVFGSRDLAWVGEVTRATAGQGVDVVLNSLSGEALQRGFETLAAGGRFVELGKQDIYAGTSLSLKGFCRNASFAGASLDVLSPGALRDLCDEVWRLVGARELAPLPIEEFAVSDLPRALDHLASAKHIGKVVIASEDAVSVADTETRVVRADRTYLVTGGLGALGLVAAARLARCGARHLVLAGRSVPGGVAREAVAALARDGVAVRIAAVDVSERAALAALLDDIARNSPPLAGVVHCAGTLRDATIRNLDDDAFRSVLATKAGGAWNLHRLTRDLDFFVMFSSTAGVLGSAGQASYAAANAFLDALAHYRQRRGLPALSISWGAWRIGMAEAVRPLPALSFDADQGAEVLESVLQDRAPHVLAVKGPAPRLTNQTSTGSVARPRRSQIAVEDEIRRSVGELADMRPEALTTHDTLAALGIDSLAAIRLRSRIAERLDVALPPTDVGPDTTLAALVQRIEAHRAEARPAAQVSSL